MTAGRLLRRGDRTRQRRRAAGAAMAIAPAVLGAAAWWARTHPSPLPYAQRFFVQVPHPLLTRRRLLRTLDARPGEAVLEVGPGTGLYTHAIADRVGASGSVALVDVQQEMLDHTLRAARRRGLANLYASRADARELPYEQGTFDAVVTVRTLGEVPDRDAALRELHRVLRPGGRLVVGEAADDPHFVTTRALRRRAEAAGFTEERRDGLPLAYFALFRR